MNALVQSLRHHFFTPCSNKTRNRRSSVQAMAACTLSVQEVAKDAPLLPRSGACMAPLPPGHAQAAVMIGGYVEAPDKTRQGTNEVWAYDRTGGWTLVPTNTDGPAPQPRLAAQAVLAGGAVWLIGGWDPSVQGPDAFLSDVWRLDLASWQWARMEPQGEALGGGISRFQAVAVGDLIYIHTHRCSDHVITLDVSTSPPTLARRPVAPDPKEGAPSARGLHSLTRVGGTLLLFGGAPQSGPMLNDLWRLDLDTLAWTRLHPSGPAPHVRCSAVAAAAGPSKLLVVGGAFYGASGGLEMLGDAHVYDAAANAWQPAGAGPGAGALPSPRNAAAFAPLNGGGGGGGLELLVHGGWKAFVETYNDTYVISPA